MICFGAELHVCYVEECACMRVCSLVTMVSLKHSSQLGEMDETMKQIEKITRTQKQTVTHSFTDVHLLFY